MSKKMNYEQAANRLDEIVKLLEKGEKPLEESLALYEEGKKLVAFCTEILDNAEQKVNIIKESAAGIVEEPFAAEE